MFPRRAPTRLQNNSRRSKQECSLDNGIDRFLAFGTTDVPPPDRDPERPVYVISVAASIVSVHPRTLRIYEEEGLICPARTPTNIRLYSENDVRRVMWIRHLTQNLGVNLAGVRILFELEERLGTRILERLYNEAEAVERRGHRRNQPDPPVPAGQRASRGIAAATSLDPRTRRPRNRQEIRCRSEHPPRTTSAPSPSRDLPLVALRETVIFPEMIVPLQVGRDKSVAALNAAVADGGRIALVTQRQADQEDITDPASCTPSGRWPRSPRSSSSRTAPSGPSSRARRACALHGFAQTEPYIRAAVEELDRRDPDGRRGPGADAHPSRPRSSSTSRPARPCRRRPPSPPATSPSPACSRT